MNVQRTLRVHLVEGDRPVKILLERSLEGEVSTMISLRSGAQAADVFRQQASDMELDFELPGIGRVETRRRSKGEQAAEFLLLTPQSRQVTEIDLADFEADFAYDPDGPDQFLTKPLTAAELVDIAAQVEARLQAKAQSARNKLPAAPVTTLAGSEIVLGKSPAMLRLLQIARRVAAGTASILIQGETGTGKTVLARQIHAMSPRSEERFVAINCSAFQDHLLESELFGHEKGSFTGASQSKTGLFELAHRGTLFLDEVGDMTPAMQAKLLQVLDDGELRRVGGTKTRMVDARVLAASNKDLQDEVKGGRFREDLYFRLNVIRLDVPRLAERRQDIAALVSFFLERFRLAGEPPKEVAPDALELLVGYAWPGNVRELANTIEGLVLLAPEPTITAQDLPPALRRGSDEIPDESGEPVPLSEMERRHIVRALRYTEGKKAPAARLLGIDVKTLRSKIKSYELDDPD